MPLGWTGYGETGLGIALYAPTAWAVADHSAAGGIAAQIAALQETLPDGVMQRVLDQALALSADPDAAIGGDSPDRLRFVGILPGEDNGASYLPNVTVLVADSQGATLPALLNTARYELRQTNAVTLLNAQIVDDLRPGNRDAALLRFRQDGTARYGVPDLEIRTDQAIFLNDSQTQVAIVTLSAPAEAFAELEETFAELIGTVLFE